MNNPFNTQNQFQCRLSSAGKKPFTVSSTGEYTHCSTVSLSDNTSWVFRLRDASYIKKNCNLLVASELRPRWRHKKEEKDEHPILWNVTSAQQHVPEKSNCFFVCNHNTLNTKKKKMIYQKKATKRSVNILLMNK